MLRVVVSALGGLVAGYTGESFPGARFLWSTKPKGNPMSNRILAYLSCDCCRRRQRQSELESIADGLDSLTGDLVRIEAFDEKIHVSIMAGWTVDDPGNASEELADLLHELGRELVTSAERLEGGAA